MQPSRRRISSRTARSSPPPGGRRIRRRSLLALAATGAVALASGGVVAARGGGDAATAPRAEAPVTGARTVAARTSLPDVPWLAWRGDGPWIFGRGDRSPIRALPEGELGLAIDAMFVATMVPTPAGASLVRFRDTATGRRMRDVASPIWVSAGAFTSRGLVVTGYGDATMTADGGLLAIDPDDGTVTTLVSGAPFGTALGSPVARGDVLVSPSGRTVASNACGPERCLLHVVDLASGLVTQPVDGDVGFLRAVSDESVVTTDDAGRWIRGRAIADGRETWRRDAVALIEPAALDDGSVVAVVGSAKAGWAISTIDAAGHLTDLTRRDRRTATPPRLWRSVMTPGLVVFGTMGFEEALGTGRSATVTVLAPRTGHASTTSVQLPADAEAVR
jgi:hypothetical protein